MSVCSLFSATFRYHKIIVLVYNPLLNDISQSAVGQFIEKARQDAGGDQGGDQGGAKRAPPDEDEEEKEPADDVRLHEEGWRDR